MWWITDFGASPSALVSFRKIAVVHMKGWSWPIWDLDAKALQPCADVSTDQSQTLCRTNINTHQPVTDCKLILASMLVLGMFDWSWAIHKPDQTSMSIVNMKEHRYRRLWVSEAAHVLSLWRNDSITADSCNRAGSSHQSEFKKHRSAKGKTQSNQYFYLTTMDASSSGFQCCYVLLVKCTFGNPGSKLRHQELQATCS